MRQYQVEVDPVRLRAFGVSLAAIKTAIQRSNSDVGGRLVEMGEREFMVRGRGYIKEIRDLEQIPLGVGAGGTPLYLADVANITIGPEIRRGLAEWNGEGETVGGVVVVRSGADTLSTIAGVKERLAELEAGLPDDVEISVGLRPHRAHRALDRDPDPHPDRGVDHRRPGLHHLPLPLPLGVRGHHLDPVSPSSWPSSSCGSRASAPTSCRWEASPSPSACWSMRP